MSFFTCVSIHVIMPPYTPLYMLAIGYTWCFMVQSLLPHDIICQHKIQRQRKTFQLYEPIYYLFTYLDFCGSQLKANQLRNCLDTKSCPTLLRLHRLQDCSLPGFSVHGIFQTKILEWVAISFSINYAQSFINCVKLMEEFR